MNGHFKKYTTKCFHRARVSNSKSFVVSHFANHPDAIAWRSRRVMIPTTSSVFASTTTRCRSESFAKISQHVLTDASERTDIALSDMNTATSHRFSRSADVRPRECTMFRRAARLNRVDSRVTIRHFEQRVEDISILHSNSKYGIPSRFVSLVSSIARTRSRGDRDG